MSKNCLVSKLKSTISNENIPLFGSILLKLSPKGQAVVGYIGISTIAGNYGAVRATCTVEILEGENVTLSDDSGTDFGRKHTYNSSTASLKSTNNQPIGNVKLKISKYDTFCIVNSSTFNVEVNPEHLEYASNLVGIEIPADWHVDDNTEVDLSFLKGKTPSITFIGDTRRTVLSHLVEWFPNLKIINCNECRGTIYDAEPLENLEYLLSAYIQGDIATFVQHKRESGHNIGNIILRCNQTTLNAASMANGQRIVTWDADSIIITMESPKNAYTLGASASKVAELTSQGYAVTQCD